MMTIGQRLARFQADDYGPQTFNIRTKLEDYKVLARKYPAWVDVKEGIGGHRVTFNVDAGTVVTATIDLDDLIRTATEG